jgi:putative peptidoglycan lipid II flippase
MLGRTAIARASGLRLVLAILQKAVAFISLPLIAAIFGISGEYESYLVASSIPTLVVAFISMGAINIVFLPVFNDYRTNFGDREAWDLAGEVLSAYMLAVTIVAVAGILASPFLVRLSAPGMAGDLQCLGGKLAMVLFVSTIASGATSALTGLANSLDRLVAPAVCQLVGTAIGVASVLVLRDTIGPWSLVIASILTAAIPAVLLAVMHRDLLHDNLRLTWKPRHPGIRRVLGLFAASSVSAVAVQVSGFSTRFFASLIGPGAIATYMYAHKLVVLVTSLFVNTLTVPVFASLSQYAAKGDTEGLSAGFAFGLRLLGIFLVPVTVLCVFLREPIVRLLYERGAFPPDTTLDVSSLFLILSVTIILQGLSNLLGYTYYALQKPRPVTIIVVASIALTVVLQAALVGPWDLHGLAVATSVAYAVGTAANYLYLRRLVGGLNERSTVPCVLKVLLASVIGGGVSRSAAGLWPGAEESTLAVQAFALAFSVSIGLLVYLGLLLVFRVDEATVLIRKLRCR